jgi:hypothetical protein
MKEQDLIKENWMLIFVGLFLVLCCISALVYQTVFGEFSKSNQKEPENRLLPAFFTYESVEKD